MELTSAEVVVSFPLLDRFVKCLGGKLLEVSCRILRGTLQGTNISPKNGILKMIFLFPRWDMLIPWRVAFLIKE